MAAWGVRLSMPSLIFRKGLDLKEAVAGATFGIFYNQGENCNAGSRILVHDKVHDAFMSGLMGAVQLSPRPGAVGARATEVFTRCFGAGVLVRVTGDTVAMSPPFIVERAQIDRLVETLRTVIAAVS